MEDGPTTQKELNTVKESHDFIITWEAIISAFVFFDKQRFEMNLTYLKSDIFADLLRDHPDADISIKDVVVLESWNPTNNTFIITSHKRLNYTISTRFSLDNSNLLDSKDIDDIKNPYSKFSKKYIAKIPSGSKEHETNDKKYKGKPINIQSNNISLTLTTDDPVAIDQHSIENSDIAINFQIEYTAFY